MLTSLLLPVVFFAIRAITSPLSPRLTFRQYIVHNECPAAINLYIGGALDSNIPAKGNVTRFLGLGAGFFYSDANGGNADGTGATRAGFFADDFYYIVQGLDHINTGIQVVPQDRPSRLGFCQGIECDSVGCTEAFTQPPTRFPAPASIAPPPPYYECPFDNTTFHITFCPQGKFPNGGTAIHPNFNQNKCLDVRGAVFANGTPVQIYDCNLTPAQQWVINRGSTKVRVAGTNFCLDAGTNPANGIGLKIWQCYDQLPAQQWYYTDDNRIALENQGFCTDLTGGILTNSNPVQEWQCTDFNTNQIWTL